jgi:sec-independent protein translocase protein TatA
MGSFSIWHWLVVLLVVLLLFGSGKISGLMGDLAKGIKSFKHNIKEDQADASMEAQAPGQSQPAGSIQGPAAASSTAQATAAQNTPPRPGA